MKDWRWFHDSRLRERRSVFAMLIVAVAQLLAACGGSSSESPMPLEPVPHQGEEPPADDQNEDSVDDEMDQAELDGDPAEDPTEDEPLE